MRTQYRIELTTILGCPCACDYCPQDKFLNAYKGEEKLLTVENLKRYLKNVPSHIGLSLAGYSEPLRSPYIIDLLKYICSERTTIVYTTLFKVDRKVIRYLFHENITTVTLHLPELEGWTAIEVDDTYLLSIETLLKHAKLKKRKVNYVCWGTMYPEIQEILDRYKEVLCVFGGFKSGLNDRGGSLDLDWIPHTYVKGRIECRSHNVYHLLPNGDVSICCQDFGLNHILGNLGTQHMNDIIDGDEIKSMIHKMNQYDSEIICRMCQECRPTDGEGGFRWE